MRDRLWDGINAVIFSDTPTLPMQMEVALTEANPDLVTKIDSFEDYDDAFDFCKNQRNVNLFLISDAVKTTSPLNVFDQLSKPAKSRGLPCFALLFSESIERIDLLKAVMHRKDVIGYERAEKIISRQSASAFLERIFKGIQTAYEETIFPESIYDSVLELINGNTSRTEVVAIERLNTLLTSNLRLSWLERMQTRWSAIISQVPPHQSDFLRAHRVLSELTQLPKMSDIPAASIQELVSAPSLNLSVKVSLTLLHLIDAKKTGTLEETLSHICASAVPGSKALLRHIAIHRERIGEVLSEVGTDGVRHVREA